MRLSAFSLRNKILFFSAMLVIVPGALLGVLSERNGRASLEGVIGRQLAREAGHTADRISTLIRVEQETLEAIARQDVMREIRIADLDKRIAQALNALASGSETRLAYLVVDHEQSLVAVSDSMIMQAPPDWIARNEAKTGIIGILAATGARPELLLGTPIPDPDLAGESLGTLFAVLDWRRLTNVTDRIRSELEAREIAARIVISDREGAILRTSPIAESGTNADDVTRVVGDIPSSPDFIVDATAGLIIGRARLPSLSTSWSLLVIQPLSQALAPALRLRNRLALTTAVALAAALALAGVGASRVIQPLGQLTTAIRGLTRGESSNLHVPVRSSDEVGTLAAAFNKMAAELDEAQRHLVEAEKFAFVGEVAAGVAHQVRTSLGVLRSSAQILARSLADESDPSNVEMIDMIRAEVDRLGRVVDDLLTLDHRRPLDLRPTDLSIPVGSAVDFLAPQADEKGILLERRLPRPGPTVTCDPEAIEQACVNLIANAIASVGRGNRIEVSVDTSQVGTTSFSVRDDGPGVPAEIRERIFDPFVTGRSAGVGLGLTFVNRIAHAHRGRATLVPHDGKGAWFRVELPAQEEAG